MVNINQIERGVARYAESEILPKLNVGGLARIAIGTAVGVVVKRVGTILEAYTGAPALAMLGVVDTGKNIDLDLLMPEVKKSIPAEGIHVEIPNPLTGTPLAAMTFRADDVDRLYQYIVQS